MPHNRYNARVVHGGALYDAVTAVSPYAGYVYKLLLFSRYARHERVATRVILPSQRALSCCCYYDVLLFRHMMLLLFTLIQLQMMRDAAASYFLYVTRLLILMLFILLLRLCD